MLSFHFGEKLNIENLLATINSELKKLRKINVVVYSVTNSYIPISSCKRTYQLFFVVPSK